MLSPERLSEDSLAPGSRFGPYLLVRTLGVGGFGAVYEARHEGTDARVALKILHAHRYRDPEVRERFLREARASAEVRHPHVVEVYDVAEVEGTACIAMSYLEGPTLAETLDRHGAMCIEDALDVMVPLMSAVQAAHDAGIVHRDLKPENVVLARNGDRLHPTLLDFGIAKLTTEAVSVTQTNMVFGTAHYMSPEQARDTKSAAPHSDQWSLAVMLFECVTGDVPWPGETLVDVQIQMMERPEVSARARRDTLPPGLDPVLRTALRRDPKDRYPSVRAFGEALLVFARRSTREAWTPAFRASITDRERAAATPSEAPPEAPSAPSTDAPRRHRTARVGLAAAAVGIALALGLILALRPDAPAPVASATRLLPAMPRAVAAPRTPVAAPPTLAPPTLAPPAPPPPAPTPPAAAVVATPRPAVTTTARPRHGRPHTGVPIL
jgi:serine/threonine-protein kinase